MRVIHKMVLGIWCLVTLAYGGCNLGGEAQDKAGMAMCPVLIHENAEMQLPELPPAYAVDSSVVVQITSTSILVDDMKVAVHNNGAVDPSLLVGQRIGPVYDALTQRSVQLQQIARAKGIAPSGTQRVLFMMDQRALASLIIKVRATATEAGFGDQLFVVKGPNPAFGSCGAYGVVRPPALTIPPQSPLYLEVLRPR